MAKIRILLADDHKLFREGLRLLLEAQGDFEVVAEAADGQEALKKARESHPEVMVMDITMQPMDGLAATRLARKEMPEVRVLILTMHGGEEYFFRALEAGASGYLLKEGASADLATAIRAVARGGVFLYPSIAGRLVEDYLQRVSLGEERSSFEKLTDREKEILALIAQGHTNQEMAERLYLSINTVQTHRTHIMEKLNLHSRAELMKYAIRLGFLRPPSPS